MPAHSGHLVGARTLEDMKTTTTDRRRTRRTPRHTAGPAIDPGADPLRGPGDVPDPGAPAGGPVSVGPDTYDVRCDVVSTRQGADPAQIPWLEEVGGGSHPHDTVSGVI